MADGWFEFANPDVAKPDRIAVKLERNRASLRMRLVMRGVNVAGWSHQFKMIEHQHTILQQRDMTGLIDVAIPFELRHSEHNVVIVPFTWFSHRVGQWRCLLIDRTRPGRQSML